MNHTHKCINTRDSNTSQYMDCKKRVCGDFYVSKPITGGLYLKELR